MKRLLFILLTMMVVMTAQADDPAVLAAGND